MILRVMLTPEQRAEIVRGQFVRVELGRAVDTGGVRARSALVGRANGRWRAFANVCRHQAVALDFSSGTPMADDGHHLLCHQHGAVYRPTDGYCICGPCAGESLAPLEIEEEGEALILRTPQ